MVYHSLIVIPIIAGILAPYCKLSKRSDIILLISTILLPIGYIITHIPWAGGGGVTIQGNISKTLVMLTLVITPISILSTKDNDIKASLLILQGLLIGSFTVDSVLLFFILFETILFPLFWLIGKHGNSEDKVNSTYKLFFYTVSGSLIWLIGILIVGSISSLTKIKLLDYDLEKLLFPLYFIPFAVKLPLFPIHTWLNEAHTEAPTPGSIILAGLILKLSPYGIIKWLYPLIPYGMIYYKEILIVATIIGVIYSSLTTIRQIDLKRMIAYSSVAHMNVVLFGILSNDIQSERLGEDSLQGAILMSVGHGFISTLLFYIVGTLYYRHNTRLIYYYRGLSSIYPLLTFIFLIGSLANCAFPPSINWFSELLIFSKSIINNTIEVVFIGTSIILSIIYSLWTYSRMSSGILSSYIIRSHDLTRKEFYILIFLIILILILTPLCF